MSFYDNAICPVCNKQLGEDDNIVTCPVCGTPHHRECYNQIGNCANAHLHGTGYDYADQQKDNKSINVDIAPDTAKEEENENPIIPQIPFAPVGANTVATSFDSDTDTICGKSVAEVAVSVGVNAHKFVDTFKALDKGEKKFKWNWFAFFFTSLYFAFRKMYAKGIALMCVELATYFISSACMLKFAPQTMAAMQELLTQYANNNVDAVNALSMEIMGYADYPIIVAISFAMLGVMLLIRLICGLVANKTYLKHIIGKIDKVEEMVKDGKALTMPVMFSTEKPPTAEDLKKMQLARNGGINLFAPLLLYSATELLSLAANYLF